jgi:hypothetical protein
VDKSELHAAIQSQAADDRRVPEGALLTRWVLVREFVTPSGGKALDRMTGTLDGSELSVWDAKGFLYEALTTINAMPNPPHEEQGEFDVGDEPPPF